MILCGQTEQIGQGVIAGLKPEYEGESFPPFSLACLLPLPHLECLMHRGLVAPLLKLHGVSLR